MICCENGAGTGDVLTGINGFEMNDPQKMLEAYTKLARADQLTATVMRAARISPRRTAPLADRFMVMEHGRVIQEFTQAELPSRMDRLHEYLGV